MWRFCFDAYFLRRNFRSYLLNGDRGMKREIIFRGKKYNNDNWEFEHIQISSNIEPCTVGQFTGLHDKNGKRIFEGDRVRYTKHPGYNLPSFESIIIYDSNVAAFAIEGFPANIYFSDLHELQEDLLNHLEVVE